MDRIRLSGSGPLKGTIPISGAKNAALPLMIASLLTEDTLILENVPRLRDVRQLTDLLTDLGVDFTLRGRQTGQNPMAGQTIKLNAANIVSTTASYDLVSKMRASFWVFGPLLARFGKAKVSLPGGCAIGTRPVDFFIAGMEALGAKIDVEAGYVIAEAKDGLIGGRFRCPRVSVGATHTLMMAATLARGTTVLENSAQEPEVVDLAECLIAMGARITGAGTETITIEGVDSLHGATHAVLPDRIETGTFAMAVAMTGGDVLLEGARADLLQEPIDVMRRVGITIEETNRGLQIQRNGTELQSVNIDTQPFPGFPTDLQAQFMALMTRANGTSEIRETIFENRFMHVQELTRLGASIRLDGQSAFVDGVANLTGAPVMATDLRASVSLVIAGLAAEGDTIVNRVYHLDRGFERLEEKLSACGADIERIST